MNACPCGQPTGRDAFACRHCGRLTGRAVMYDPHGGHPLALALVWLFAMVIVGVAVLLMAVLW